MLYHHFNPQMALNLPRFLITHNGDVQIEKGIDTDVIQGLKNKGKNHCSSIWILALTKCM